MLNHSRTDSSWVFFFFMNRIALKNLSAYLCTDCIAGLNVLAILHLNDASLAGIQWWTCWWSSLLFTHSIWVPWLYCELTFLKEWPRHIYTLKNTPLTCEWLHKSCINIDNFFTLGSKIQSAVGVVVIMLFWGNVGNHDRVAAASDGILTWRKSMTESHFISGHKCKCHRLTKT